MTLRTNHYMKPAMLHSQLHALEAPSYALSIDISLSVDDIVDMILAKTKLSAKNGIRGLGGEK